MALCTKHHQVHKYTSQGNVPWGDNYLPASSSLVIYCCNSRMLVLLKCLKTLTTTKGEKCNSKQKKKNVSEGKTINTARVCCNPFEVGANQQFSTQSRISSREPNIQLVLQHYFPVGISISHLFPLRRLPPPLFLQTRINLILFYCGSK